MDSYERHQRFWYFIQPPIRRWMIRKFNLTYEDLHVEGPMLLVPNHASAWDPLLVSASLTKKQVYYVASEHLFRLGLVSRIIAHLVSPIPRRKASTGMDTVKACLRELKAGHSVCLFAEGEQCWAGRTNPVFPATGKLVKSSGASLVTYRLEGAYLSLPRWGKGVRRGAVHGHPVGIYPPELLKGMTPNEINTLIERDIREDAWERQRDDPVAYPGRHRAEGMEQAFCLCPRCRRIGTLRTRDIRIFCDCGLDLTYTETGFFLPDTPFAHPGEWDRWQTAQLRTGNFVRPDSGPLFSDTDVTLCQIVSDHRDRVLEQGDLALYEDRLICGSRSFPLQDISSMADVLANRLLFSFDGGYYEIRARHPVCLRKYIELWKAR
ncbi:MAG: 1-acyl-sn-glycerol-3-phosphate acyltransferase [Oscillospiraceae bacterium]|nr:1-acyl-sn-glycerol-3-phosphate acyltransferase [Oscillospiraceae bacterium]